MELFKLEYIVEYLKKLYIAIYDQNLHEHRQILNLQSEKDAYFPLIQAFRSFLSTLPTF